MPSTWERSEPVEDSFRIAASWYDGRTAVRHEGQGVWDGADTLVLSSPTAEDVATLSELVFAENRGRQAVYRSEARPDFRLILPGELPPGLAHHLPREGKYGGWIDRLGLGKAVAIFAVASAAVGALFLTAPDWLGPRIPASWERNLGEAMIGDFGGRLCHTPAGDAALQKLLDSMDPENEQVRAGIANIDMVNAVALPGGQVLLFDGLVQQAQSPAELAGVLGHEIGHVRERHVMTALLRQFGLSILLAGANSGVSDTIFGVAAMGYSREAEREADAYARARMKQSNVSPLGAASFFERLAEQYGDAEDQPALVGWIASHPAPGERAGAYRVAAKSGADYPPVLTNEEFVALKSMCRDDPHVEEFEFF